MSGHSIKTGSAVGHEQTRTDWAKLRTQSDDEIDAAIASDADCYALETEILGRMDSAYHYEVVGDEKQGYRWRLVGADGSVLASSVDTFSSKAAVTKAIADLRTALLGGDLLAA